MASAGWHWSRKSTVYRDFEHYAAVHGASRQDVGDAGMHRGYNRQSQSSRRVALDRMDAKDRAWEARRTTLRSEFERGVADGRIRVMPEIQRLRDTARGTGPAAEAAARVLAKRAARMASAGKGG